ncbi:hypothetical protein ACFL0V_04720 [Nanoarchaeota archaeon]
MAKKAVKAKKPVAKKAGARKAVKKKTVKPKRSSKGVSKSVSKPASKSASKLGLGYAKPKLHAPGPKKPFVLQSHHYYIIYVGGFFVLSLLAFIFVKNLVTAVPDTKTVYQPIEAEIEFEAIPGNMLTPIELERLLNNSGKTHLLPEDYVILIYFYDENQKPSGTYYTFKDGKVKMGKSKDYELSISTGEYNMPELKKSTNFCLVMETIWVRGQDIKIEYGISKLTAFAKYGGFATACVPSAMSSITGYQIMDSQKQKADSFYWFLIIPIGFLIAFRLYVDLLKQGY